MPVKISLIGRVTVELDDAVVDEAQLVGRQGRLLFAYLVAEHARPVPRDGLAEALWGDTPPATWEKALTVLASKLRRLFADHGLADPSLLTAAFGCYRLQLPEGTWVDVHEAATAAADAERALHDGDLEHARARAAVANSLLQRPFLPGEDGAWVEATRRKLTDTREIALTTLTDASLRAGDAPAAVDAAGQLIALAPLRESGYRRLMEAHAAAGNRAEALGVYGHCRQLLADELGAYPSPETDAIYRDLLELPTVGGGGTAPPAPPDPEEPLAAPERHGRRRRGVLAAALVAVAAGAMIAILALQGDDGASVPASVGNALAILEPGSGRLVADIAVGTAPGDVATSEGAAWVAHAGDGTVYRIDAKTRTVRQTIRVGSSAGGIAAGEGYVWVADGLEGTLVRIDPRSNEITDRIPVGNGPAGVAVGAGFVWVVARDDHRLVQLAPASGRIVGRIPAGSDPVDLAVADGAVWVTSEAEGTVRKIDAHSGRTLDTVPVGRGPGPVAVGAGALWVANTLDGTVSRVDPKTLAVTATIEVGRSPSGIAVLEGAVWVTAELDGAVVRIDPATNGATTVAVGGRPSGVAVSPAGILVAVRPGGAPHVGGTLTAAFDVISIDTFRGESWQLLGLTNDGLTSFRRVGGKAGSRIVANLATSVPRPLDAGRTYVFTLRRGIRYSSGRAVRPVDVRASLERIFEVESGSAFLYGGIVGADACLERPRPCNLSRGVVVDDRLHTVTFRLTEPDPDLPAKLALPYAFVLPDGTPSRDTGTRPLPATGPYAIASFVPGRRLRLVRNPAFDDELRPLRPAGYPDEIVVRLDVPMSRRATQVSRDRIDLAGLLGGPDLTEIRKRHGSRLHSNPSQALLYVFLNTSVPPFDDVRVRAALNHAVDRARSVLAFGGVERAAASCQVLPPNFPGYRPYCPWKLDPAAARRVVAGSGTRETDVVVWASTSSVQWVRPVVTALRELGYTARLRTVADDRYFDTVQREGASAQAGFFGWEPNYVSPADAIVPFTCREARDGGMNLSRFCDREVERLAARALVLRTTDQAGANRLWEHVDRAITDRAPLVPLLNPRTADFVSTRVGNYQFNPVWGVLLEQLWVQ